MSAAFLLLVLIPVGSVLARKSGGGGLWLLGLGIPAFNVFVLPSFPVLRSPDYAVFLRGR